MSLRTFAARTTYSVTYIDDVERGKRQVSRSFADKVRQVFELELHVHQWKCDCGAEHA